MDDRLTVILSKGQKKQLKKIAVEKDTSMTKLVLEAITDITGVSGETGAGKQMGIHTKKLNKFGRIHNGTIARLQTHDAKYIFNFKYNAFQGCYLFSDEHNNDKAKQAVKEKTAYNSRHFVGTQEEIKFEMSKRSATAIDLSK